MLNQKLNNHNGGKRKGTNVGNILPTATKHKLYDGGDLSKCESQSLSCKRYQGKEWGKLGKKPKAKIYDWRKELKCKPDNGK